MRLLELSLMNVGPFDDATLRLLDGPDDPRVVTLLTGENGTGKTVVLDAVRRLFGNQFAEVERDLSRRGETMEIRGQFHRSGTTADDFRITESAHPDWRPASEMTPLSMLEQRWRTRRGPPPEWVVDYWRSELARDIGTINALKPPDVRQALCRALQGTYNNTDVTQSLVYLDYLRDSRDDSERRAGAALWGMAEKIVGASLLEGGRLVGIERKTFTPMIEQVGRPVPLGNLSSGNAYLIGRMLTLLGRMYSLTVARELDPEATAEMPGLLLIDEAENHLHPKWQKRLIPMVRSVFPNLQIIATTHSPFVLSSVADARVFVCRYDRERRSCVIEEESSGWTSLPVDEILASPAFDETRPFSEEISGLLAERDHAIQAGDRAKQQGLEARLLELNPTYFAWFRLANDTPGAAQ